MQSLQRGLLSWENGWCGLHLLFKIQANFKSHSFQKKIEFVRLLNLRDNLQEHWRTRHQLKAPQTSADNQEGYCQNKYLRTSPVPQWLRLHTSPEVGTGSIPGLETKVQRGVQCRKKKKEKERKKISMQSQKNLMLDLCFPSDYRDEGSAHQLASQG